MKSLLDLADEARTQELTEKHGGAARDALALFAELFGDKLQATPVFWRGDVFVESDGMAFRYRTTGDWRANNGPCLALACRANSGGIQYHVVHDVGELGRQLAMLSHWNRGVVSLDGGETIST